MLQLVYVSSATPQSGPLDSDAILAVSRRNNARDAITGLLYADARRFMQVLEGPREAVMRAFARIGGDPRHRAIVILWQSDVDTRQFGEWAMASLDADADRAGFLARIETLVAGADAKVRATFDGFARTRLDAMNQAKTPRAA